jgi:hypothetical protein
MFFAVVQNNTVVEYPLTYDNVYNRFLNPAGKPMGFMDTEYLLSCGVVRVKPQDFPTVAPTDIVMSPQPKFINGEWVEIYEVRAMTPQEIAQNEPALTATAREQRKILLQQSDWTQISDATVDKISWATYRQALRDITTQSGFPWNITWPAPPQQ